MGFVADAIGAVADFFFGCGDCCVGNTNETSGSEAHAKKVADELAEMKERMEAISRENENKIVDSISISMDEFLKNVKELNNDTYGGKSLNINVDLIIEKNEALKRSAVGSISHVLDQRLVQTDKELSVILNERDEKKRKKTFEKFVEKVTAQAKAEFKKKTKETVAQQSGLIKKEIDTRLDEVNESMKDSIHTYTDILGFKQEHDQELEDIQVMCMYQTGLNELLLAVVDE